MPIPIAAAPDLADVLTSVFVVLLAAKLGDELFKRLGQPTIVGEILAGVLIGPSVLGLVEPGEVLKVLAELGVVFLLFWVGLETRLSEMRAVGREAISVGVAGVVLPFAGGLGAGFALGYGAATSVFLGAALVATSVGITSAVLVELGVLRTRASRTIIGAAVVDDILALILLALAVGIADEGGINAGGLIAAIVLSLVFVVFFAVGGTRLLQARPRLLEVPRFAQSPLMPAVLLCLGLAAFAAQIGLAAIIGAFLAGMMVAETKEQTPIHEEIAPLYAFFPPFFFVFIGMELQLGELMHGSALLLLTGIVVLAVVTKFAGAWAGAYTLGARQAAIVGVGMVPRGEVGIVVAGLGATAGVIDAELFAVIVGMSVFTTLAVPPVLRRLTEGADESGPGPPSIATPSPVPGQT